MECVCTGIAMLLGYKHIYTCSLIVLCENKIADSAQPENAHLSPDPFLVRGWGLGTRLGGPEIHVVGQPGEGGLVKEKG